MAITWSGNVIVGTLSKSNHGKVENDESRIRQCEGLIYVVLNGDCLKQKAIMAMGTLECVSLNICYGNRVPVVVRA